MSTRHIGGNIIGEVTLEEHDGTQNARNVSLVSAATIYVSTPAGISTVFQGGAPWQAMVTLFPGPNYIGLVTNVAAKAWPDPQTFIGLVSITGAVGLSPTGTTLNTYSIHLTTNTTTTPTSSTAYVSSIVVSAEVAGTTSTVTIQDKQGTPLKLVNGLSTTALTTAPTVVNFQTPVKMVSGIDIITGGAVAATIDVWVNYYQ